LLTSCQAANFSRISDSNNGTGIEGVAGMHARQRSRAVILLVVESVRRPALPPVELPVIDIAGDSHEQDPFVQLLREDGYDVVLVEGTTLAIAYLDQHPPPDVFIADIQTPLLDAVFIARYARSRHPLLPIAFVTSYPERIEIAANELDPEPLLFTKPLDYRLFGLELRRMTRRNSSSLVIDNVSYLDENQRPRRGSK
jgi:CheY-like chemotaxis protein